ncbi:MAG: diguanylate cyclase [Actinomycetota bacterium]
MNSTAETDETGDLQRDQVLEAVASALSNGPVGLVLVELWVEGENGEPIDPGAETRRELATRLSRCLDNSDELLTANVDRQLIIKRNLSAPAETEGFALRLLNALGGPVNGGPTRGVCHSTIGVAVSHASDGAEDLLRHAEHALTDAHLLGGDIVVCFEDEDREILPERQG